MVSSSEIELTLTLDEVVGHKADFIVKPDGFDSLFPG